MSEPGQDKIGARSGHRLFLSDKWGRALQTQVFEVFGEFIAAQKAVKINLFTVVQMLIPFLRSDAPVLHFVVFKQYVRFL